MITPKEFRENIDLALEATAVDMESTMQEAAMSAKALLARRIQNKGFGRKYTSRAYVALRASKGYQINFVNLTFTGKMFQGWNVPGRFREGLKVTGFMAGSDQETKNKLAWNKARYPNFDQLNDEELSLIKDTLIAPRVLDALTKNLFKK